MEDINIYETRSSYGVIGGRGGDKKLFPAVFVYRERNKIVAHQRTLKHKPFKSATKALQYSTKVSKRLRLLAELQKYDEALCLCGHDQGVHREDFTGVGRCRMGSPCECARYVWVWSREGIERSAKKLGCVTLSEEIAD